MGTDVQLAGAAVATAGVVLFAKANSGKIKFNDGTGINPKTGKYFDDKDEAIEYYKALKDQKQKDNFRKWLKGKEAAP